MILNTMKNKVVDISNELAAEISNATYHKNVLLIYQQNTSMPELTYCMVSEILGRHKSSLAWICWGEPSNMVKERLVNFGCDANSVAIIDTVSNFVDDECTIICAPTNYSSIMRNVHKLIKNGECILVLDNPGKTGAQISDTAYIKFQSVLLKNKNPGVTIITSIKSSLLDVNAQKTLSSQYDVVFYISKDTIKFKDLTEKKQIT